MKFWFKILVIAILDFLLIWGFVHWMEPDRSSSLQIVVLVPGVILINLFTAIFLYFLKSVHSKLYLLNAVISGVLMGYLFLERIDEHQKLRYGRWIFMKDDRLYEIKFVNVDSTFTMNYSTHLGTTSEYLKGKMIYVDDQILLKSGTITYRVKNGYLFDFSSKTDSILLFESKSGY